MCDCLHTSCEESMHTFYIGLRFSHIDTSQLLHNDFICLKKNYIFLDLKLLGFSQQYQTVYLIFFQLSPIVE